MKCKDLLPFRAKYHLFLGIFSELFYLSEEMYLRYTYCRQQRKCYQIATNIVNRILASYYKRFEPE
jgi:hypothetical protein